VPLSQNGLVELLFLALLANHRAHRLFGDGWRGQLGSGTDDGRDVGG